MDLLDLTPGSIFETVAFPIPVGMDPERSFLDSSKEFPCEDIILSAAEHEGYPTSPYLALFFNDQGIYWRLHRNLVGTPAGIDFVDHLWDYLKSHNSANKCVRFITVSVDTTDCPAKPYLMGCMHKGGVQVGTRLTPIRVKAGAVRRAGDTRLFFCDPMNCLCESVCIERVHIGH